MHAAALVLEAAVGVQRDAGRRRVGDDRDLLGTQFSREHAAQTMQMHGCTSSEHAAQTIQMHGTSREHAAQTMQMHGASSEHAAQVIQMHGCTYAVGRVRPHNTSRGCTGWCTDLLPVAVERIALAQVRRLERAVDVALLIAHLCEGGGALPHAPVVPFHRGSPYRA